MKRFLSVFCVVLLSLSMASVTVFADEVDDGIMLPSYEVELTGSVVYPSWTNFEAMSSMLPASYTATDGYVHNFDKYIIYMSNTTYSDGSYRYQVVLWDSNKIDVSWTPRSTGADRLVLSDKANITRKGLFVFYWDIDLTSLTFYSAEDDYAQIYPNRILFSSTDVYSTSDGSLISVPRGVSSYYDAFLVDDPDYPGYVAPPVDDGGDGGDEDYSGIFGWLQKIWDNLTEGFRNIVNSINSLAGSIGSFFSDLGNMIASKFQELGEAIGGFFENLLEGIKNFFIPNTDNINAIIDDLVSSVEGKFGFDSFDMEALFGTEEAPTDISAEYEIYGHKQKFVFADFSWLKQGVDFFRPYIRGFLVLLLWFFNIRMAFGTFDLDSGISSGQVAKMASSNADKGDK